MLPTPIPPLQLFKNYEFDETVMEKPAPHLARLGLNLVCHFGKTLMEVEGKVQRTPTSEMVHEIKMVKNHSTISTFTCNVNLNGLEEVLPFLFKVNPRSILLPDNAFVFKLEIRPELNVFSNGCFKPSFSSPR
jgi:hypothetical protein